MSDETTPQPTHEQLDPIAQQILARLNVLEVIAVDNAVILTSMMADGHGPSSSAIDRIEDHLNHLQELTTEGLEAKGHEGVASFGKGYAKELFTLVLNKVKERRNIQNATAHGSPSRLSN
ncbi:hypothetical protein KBI52_10850 [Microvirga sp. HBU67558]|uniref:hypothetical protein n=1 Tax=Microvirga sp. HBU67558 TaxID=2824562 RepID=UPI001B391CAC|nr:hypothetical protein [Microvirga sp. HBU67558]MBQ0820703.1 hypothetical protein [Microvirga sp. HBU67558]